MISSFQVSQSKFCVPLLLRVTRTAHPNVLDFKNLYINGKESSLYNFLHPNFTSSFSSPNIFLGSLFSSIRKLLVCEFRRMKDQVLHPYKATGNIYSFT